MVDRSVDRHGCFKDIVDVRTPLKIFAVDRSSKSINLRRYSSESRPMDL